MSEEKKYQGCLFQEKDAKVSNCECFRANSDDD